MSKGTQGFIFLLLLSLILIVIGFQGNLGRLIAIVFVPKETELTS